MDKEKQEFLDTANHWICEPCSIDTRYIAVGNGEQKLWNATILVYPWHDPAERGFTCKTERVIGGQEIRSNQSKSQTVELLKLALGGQIDIGGMPLTLVMPKLYGYHAEAMNRDIWFLTANARVVGDELPQLSARDISEIESEMRLADPPFDGLWDLTNWLALPDSERSKDRASISIRIAPPVDFVFSESRLYANSLKVVLHAHTHFDESQMALSVRAAPGGGIAGRMQVTSAIEWQPATRFPRIGTVTIPLDAANSALLMLSIGGRTVRRQWFTDTTKALNPRLFAMKHFDVNLKMIRQAVTQASDAPRFELGVAALCFLWGFAGTVLAEKDAPDIVVTTPRGRLVLIECTTRIGDFQSKLGKLVDRRGSLVRALVEAEQHNQVEALLVCALPQNQIATKAEELIAHNVNLVTQETLIALLDRLQFWTPSPQTEPDAMLDELILVSRQSRQSGSHEGS